VSRILYALATAIYTVTDYLTHIANRLNRFGNWWALRGPS
jgi:hypothetical protein